MEKNWESDQRSMPVALVILTVRDERVGEREIRLLPRRTVAGDALGGNYLERAHELHRRIGSLAADERAGLVTEAVR